MSVRPKEERLLLDERTESGQVRRLALVCAWGAMSRSFRSLGKSAEGLSSFALRLNLVLRVLVEAPDLGGRQGLFTLRDEGRAVRGARPLGRADSDRTFYVGLYGVTATLDDVTVTVAVGLFCAVASAS
jgi:hypothetical protein